MLVSLLGLESDQAKGILVISVIVFCFIALMLISALGVVIIGERDEEY